MGAKLKHMKYFFVLFLTIVSCKESKNSEKTKITIEQEIVESKVEFYKLFLRYEAEQELSNKFSLDTTKYFKTYVLQGASKMIERQLEDIKPSDVLSEEELDKLNYHIVFENYQSDFIDMYEFNHKKHDTNKTEIIYFFTYPFIAAKNKVLIGLEVEYKFHPKESSKRASMRFFIFKKVNDMWRLTEEGNLLK